MGTSGDVLTGDSRNHQMAAIRQALAEMVDEIDDAGTESKADVQESPAPRAPMRKRDDDDIESDDAVLSWVDSARQPGASKAEPTARRCDIAGLRRSHDKRVKALLRSDARRKKSGAFLTGFTLVSMVAAALVGLYIMHPQITSASPGMAPAMNEYVETVDRYRVETNEATAEWSTWLSERIGKIADRLE